MKKIILRVLIIVLVASVVALVTMKLKHRSEISASPIDKEAIAKFAGQLGKGDDATVLAALVAYNKTTPYYIFALEVKEGGVIRHATPGHIGERVDFSTHPHIHELVIFAQKQGSGTITYDATNTPDACSKKTSYVQLVHGDDNKVYVIGQGYCLLK